MEGKEINFRHVLFKVLVRYPPKFVQQATGYTGPMVSEEIWVEDIGLRVFRTDRLIEAMRADDIIW